MTPLHPRFQPTLKSVWSSWYRLDYPKENLFFLFGIPQGSKNISSIKKHFKRKYEIMELDIRVKDEVKKLELEAEALAARVIGLEEQLSFAIKQADRAILEKTRLANTVLFLARITKNEHLLNIYAKDAVEVLLLHDRTVVSNFVEDYCAVKHNTGVIAFLAEYKVNMK